MALNLRKFSKLVGMNEDRSAGYLIIFKEMAIGANFEPGDEMLNDQTLEDDGSVTIRVKLNRKKAQVQAAKAADALHA